MHIYRVESEMGSWWFSNVQRARKYARKVPWRRVFRVDFPCGHIKNKHPVRPMRLFIELLNGAEWLKGVEINVKRPDKRSLSQGGLGRRGGVPDNEGLVELRRRLETQSVDVAVENG